MRDLRRLARGQPCMARYPAICDGGGETTVLGHARLAGVSGVGFKGPDICGCWICGPCHAYADTHHDDESKVIFLEGCIRTLNELTKMGIL